MLPLRKQSCCLISIVIAITTSASTIDALQPHSSTASHTKNNARQVICRPHEHIPYHNTPPQLRLFCVAGNNISGSSLRSVNQQQQIVEDILYGLTVYYASMVDPTTNRFYSLSRPPTGQYAHQHCPIRELAATWDATTLLEFWSSHRPRQDDDDHDVDAGGIDDSSPCSTHRRRLDVLRRAVVTTLKFYTPSKDSLWEPSMPSQTVNKGSDNNNVGIMALNPQTLEERPTIAHSAFFLLASLGALKLSLFNAVGSIGTTTDFLPMDELTKGILSMQRPHDGAFCIRFYDDQDPYFNDNDRSDNNVYDGIEFYPGEAMVALMEIYEQSSLVPGHNIKESTQLAILPAMVRALTFYSNYHREGSCNVNYSIWQVQAFARLVLARSDWRVDDDNTNQAKAAETYVLTLCGDIIDSRSWKELRRGSSFYPNLNTLEIACGLDALAQGLRIATTRVSSSVDSTVVPSIRNEHSVTEDDEILSHLFWYNAKNAISFLKYTQHQVPPMTTGYGGLGYGGVYVMEQRLDVAGHALSALIKIHQLQDRPSETNH